MSLLERTWSRIQAKIVKNTEKAYLLNFGGKVVANRSTGGEDVWFPRYVIRVDSDGKTLYVADWWWIRNIDIKLNKYRK